MESGGSVDQAISIDELGRGNTDTCKVGGWTQKCDLELIPFGRFASETKAASAATDLRQHGRGDNGDIYFYSPEQLDGDRGLDNFRNVYVYRNGDVTHVAMLKTGG